MNKFHSVSECEAACSQFNKLLMKQLGFPQLFTERDKETIKEYFESLNQFKNDNQSEIGEVHLR